MILGMQLLFNQNIVRIVGYYSFESNINGFDGKNVDRVIKVEVKLIPIPLSTSLAFRLCSSDIIDFEP